MLSVWVLKGKDFVLKQTYYDDIIHVKNSEQLTKEEVDNIGGDRLQYHNFVIHTSKKTLTLMAFTWQERELWVQFLKKNQQVKQSQRSHSVAEIQEKSKTPHVAEKTLLSEKDDHLVYFENNFSVYISKNLECKQFYCKGTVYKKSNSKMA